VVSELIVAEAVVCNVFGAAVARFISELIGLQA
jgi:hypothetical protein